MLLGKISNFQSFVELLSITIAKMNLAAVVLFVYECSFLKCVHCRYLPRPSKLNS